MKYRAKRTYRKRRGSTRRKTYKKTYRKKRVYRKRKPRRRSYRRRYALRDFPREDEMAGGPVRKYQIVKPAYERTQEQKNEAKERKAEMLDELVQSGAARTVQFKEPRMPLEDVLKKYGSFPQKRAAEGWGKLAKKLLRKGYRDPTWMLPALPAAAATAGGFASGLGNAFNMGLGRTAALGAMRALPALLA